MKVLHSLESARGQLRRPVVTIGNFDGVHRGHQEILRRVRSEADTRGSSAVVLTFDPHPVSIVRPDAAPAAVMTMPDRLEALAAARVDMTIVQEFSSGFASIDADDFVRRFLVEILDADLILVGDDLNFGKERQGNVASLRAAGERMGFTVEVVPPVEVDGVVAHSSVIRRLVAAGDVAAAAKLLGRPHFVRGVVEHGAGRGKSLGYATANLRTETPLVPGDGVFVTVTMLDSRPIDSVTSIGNLPTFGGTGTVVEAHMLEDVGDIYGKPMKLEFLTKLRDQQKFDSIDALTDQIRTDVEQARSVLARHHGA